MAMIPGSLINGADVDPYPRRRPIERPDDDGAHTYALLTGAAPHQWAIVQLHTPGWTCLAVGEYDPPVPPKTWGSVFGMLIAEYGDGFDRMPPERFGLTGPEAGEVHLRRTGTVRTYCNGSAVNPYIHTPGRFMQHCPKCTTAYRAENFGRCPVES